MYNNLFVSSEGVRMHLQKQQQHLKSWALNLVADVTNSANSLYQKIKMLQLRRKKKNTFTFSLWNISFYDLIFITTLNQGTEACHHETGAAARKQVILVPGSCWSP